MMNFIFLLFSVASSSDIQIIEQLMMFGQNQEAYRRLNLLLQEQGEYPEPKVLRHHGTCAFHLRKPEEVLHDANTLLDLEETSPEITNDDIQYAHILKCRAYLLLGQFEESLSEAELTKDPNLIKSCNELLKVYNMALNFTEHGQIPEASRAIDGLLENSPLSKELILMRANIAWNQSDFDKYDALTKGIESDYSDSSEFLYRRGVTNFCNMQYDRSKNILRKAQALDDGLEEIKKNISILIPKVDQVRVLQSNYKKALKENHLDSADKFSFQALNVSLQFCPEKSNLIRNIHTIHLNVLKQKGLKDELLSELDRLLDFSPDCDEFLLERGKLNMEKEEWDAAIFDFQKLQRRSNDMKVMKLLQEAQEGKRKASHVDYYEILGIPKGSSIQEVKSAYHKMIRKWHPDQYNNKPQKRKEAEEMMKKINKAAEVLQDPQRKAMVDQGLDPDDPQPQMNVNPFDLIFGNGIKFGGQNIKIQFNFQ